MANFYARISQAASAFGARPAILFQRDDRLETTSYDALIAASTQASLRLAALGIGRGDRVAMLSANDARWVAAYLGILRIGAVAVPLDTAYTASQIATILDDCGARAIWVSGRLRDRLGDRLGDRVSYWPSGRDPVSFVTGRDPVSFVTGRDPVSSVAGRDPVSSVTVIDLADIDPASSPATLGSEVPVADVGPDDAATILYTSGTTADPKGVVLTHANWDAERAAALAVIHVTETDAVLGVLPLFHALAQMANLLVPLTVGARVVFLETVNSTSLLGALQTHEVTVFACVPQFFYLIHQRVMERVRGRGALTRLLFRALVRANAALRDTLGVNLGRQLFGQVHHALGPRMRLLITGGSRFDPAIARDLYGMGLTLLNGYGLTETSGAATVQRPSDRFSTSVGPPLPGVEVRIATVTESATVSATQETGSRRTQETGSRPGMQKETRSPRRSPGRSPGHGEILIRGAILMREYFNRPDATREALVDGWLHTGDLGFIDAEGRLHITGRSKEVIVLSSGKNLYPEEIEAHYRQSAFIKELCVLGRARPGEPAAERLHAIVVPDEDVLRARGIVNVRELLRFEIETLSVQLPAHKRILSYDIRLPPLPRTTTGKLKRGEIAKVVAEAPAALPVHQPSADEQEWAAVGTRRAALDLVAGRVGRASVGPAANLELDLGLDSMERVELLTFVEQRLGRRVPVARRATIFTVRHLIEALEQADAAEPATSEHRVVGSGSAVEAVDEWHTVLAEPAPAELTRPLGRHATARAWIVGLALRALMLPLRLGMRVEASGLDQLPARGPYLMCPNHQSHLDGFILSALIPIDLLRQVFLVGASEYFETPFAARFARFINIVPVDSDANLVTAMRVAASGLRLGRILIVFPEGERSIDGEVKAFRKGAAILGQELQVPIVPVAIDGLFDVWPRGRGVNWRALTPWRRARVTLAFGAPLRLPAGDPAAGAEILQKAVGDMIRGSSVRPEPRAPSLEP